MWTSPTPVLPPKPPVGGMTCAASPARKTRPARKDEAVAAVARPGLDVVDLDREVGARRRAPSGPARRSVPATGPAARWRLAPTVGIEGREDGEEAGIAGDREAEEGEQIGPVHIDDAEVAVADQGAHVGLEIDGDAVGEAAAALHARCRARCAPGCARRRRRSDSGRGRSARRRRRAGAAGRSRLRRPARSRPARWRSSCSAPSARRGRAAPARARPG